MELILTLGSMDYYSLSVVRVICHSLLNTFISRVTRYCTEPCVATRVTSTDFKYSHWSYFLKTSLGLGTFWRIMKTVNSVQYMSEHYWFFSNTCCTLCIYWRIQCYFHHYVTALRGCVVNNYLNLLGHCGQCWDLRNVNIISLEVKRTYILVCSHQCHVSHIFKLSKYTWCIWLLSLCALNCCHYIKMYFSMYTNMQLSVCLVWWL